MKRSKLLAADLRMFYHSGIGTYIRNLVPLIVAARPDVVFHFLCTRRQLLGYKWAQAENVVLIDCEAPIYSVGEQLQLIRQIPRGTTLFWSPHYNIPLLYSGKLLVTVHDVFHLAMPQYAGGLHKQLYAKGMFAAVRRRADAILVPSKFTKSEWMRTVGQRHQDTFCVYPGVDSSYFHIRKGRRPHPKPFLLYVGNIKPSKNVIGLLRAFKLAMNQIRHDLVIVGSKEGLKTADGRVHAEAASLGIRVCFTGYVDQELLRQYFAYADAFLFPSLYEGFGSPPLEAMAAGCPVIASDIASLPEVCGDAALYCNPYSPKHIADKIKQLINSSSLQRELRQRGLRRATQFTYEKCAQGTMAVIDDLLGN